MDRILATDVYRIFDIFSAKKWFEKNGHQEVHRRLIELIQNLTDTQKELLLELCERYLWLNLQECIALIPDLLKMVEDEKLNGCTKIVLFPIIKPKDIGKVKSSNSILYQFRSFYFADHRYNNISFIVIDSYKKFEKLKLEESDLIFLVDDFVGSGDTLKSTLEELKKNKTLITDRINVLTLVTQSEILSILKEWKISYYSINERKRGISDYYAGEELQTKTDLMTEIEGLIPKVGEYAFGYNKSEALVTLNRTPNNTFPIFWKNHVSSGKIYKAPFPR